MNYFVDVTAAARRDLAEAFDYIDLTLKNPAAADKFVDTAAEKLYSLDAFPKRCALVNDPMLSSLGVHFLLLSSHVAFFSGWTMQMPPCTFSASCTSTAIGRPS